MAPHLSSRRQGDSAAERPVGPVYAVEPLVVGKVLTYNTLSNVSTGYVHGVLLDESRVKFGF